MRPTFAKDARKGLGCGVAARFRPEAKSLWGSGEGRFFIPVPAGIR